MKNPWVSAKSGLRIRSQSQSSTSPPGDCNQTYGVEERVSVGDEVGVLQYGIQRKKEFEQVRSQYLFKLQEIRYENGIYCFGNVYSNNRPRSNFVIGTYGKATPVKFRQYIYGIYM